MPLDTNIPLQARAPEFRSPLAVIGAIGQLRGQQDLMQQRQLVNEQRQRDLDDDNAIRSTLQQFDRPEDAITDLYHQGRAEAGSKLGKTIYEYRTKQADEMTKSLKNNEDKLKLASQIMQGVNDENSFQAGKRAVGALLGDDLANSLGPSYDPKTVEQSVAWGTTRQEYLKKQQDGIKNAQDAWKLMMDAGKSADEHKKAQEEGYDHWIKAASNLLSTAEDADTWTGMQTLLKQAGAPPEVLNSFGQYEGPQSAARAGKLGMTSAEESAATRGDKNADETKRFHDAEIKHWDAIEGKGPGGEKPLTQASRNVAERAHQTDFEQAETKFNKWKKDTYGIENPDVSTLKGKDKEAYDAALDQHNANKLRIEDSYRSELGLPPLLQSEYAYASNPTSAKELRTIRNKYKTLTGQQTPLEQMQTIADQIKASKDPEEIKRLKARGASLLRTYDGMAPTAPMVQPPAAPYIRR